MKDSLSHINKVFENRIRLAIMSLLMIQESIDFNSLKERLKVTDGNLASHINTLEKKGYLQIEKSFVGKKTQTIYRSTQEGKKAFKDHLDALEKIIRGEL